MHQITLLLVVFLLASCGGKKDTSSTTFEVSRSFAVSANGFDGGLTIVGTHLATQKKFSFSLASGTNLNVQLDKGAWSISAVGWDGPTLLQGIPYCGNIHKNLTNENEVVDLVVTKGKCADSELFAGPHVDSSAGSFKELGFINSCKTFFMPNPTPTTNPQTHLITAAESNNYCDTLPQDLHSEIRGIRIRTLIKKFGEVEFKPGLASTCLTSNTSSIALTNYRLPLKTIPFLIEVFEDNSCEKQLTTFPFIHGLAQGHPEEFDHLLFSNSGTQVKLWLPSSGVRRGKSPFMALLPAIECYIGSDYLPCTVAPSGLPEFHVTAGTNAKIQINDVQSCSGLGTEDSSISAISCVPSENGVEVSLNIGTGPASFAVDGKIYDVYAVASNDSFGAWRWGAQKNYYELLGLPNSHPPSFYYIYDDSEVGVLSEVRKLLSADGPGGLIGVEPHHTSFKEACEAAQGQRSIREFDYEEMRFKSFSISIHNSPVSTPTGYLCNINDKNAPDAACPINTRYSKRLKVYDHSISTLTPVSVMEFNCEKLIGRLESGEDEERGNRRFSHKEIISWNTERGDSAMGQRFEHLRSNVEENLVNNQWQPSHYSRSMTRLEKYDETSLEAWSFKFESRRENNSWNQVLKRYQFATEGLETFCFTPSTTNLTHASDPYFIQTDSTTDSFRGTPVQATGEMHNFDLAATFPQDDLASPCGISFTALPSNNINLDGDLPFSLNSLSTNTFMGKFGTSFLTAP